MQVILREDFARGTQNHTVNRDLGIIYRVKVLGRKSPNSHGVQGVSGGTEYTLEALEGAIGLYEGIAVNADHPPREKPSKDRSAYDRLGRLINVRIEENELYADLQLLKSHPLAERLFEAAEKMPDAFGLSHNALGRGEIRNGIYFVVEIPEVRSVDVVADAGSTQSLFESRYMTKTLKELIESCKAPSKPKLLAALLELGDDYGAMPVEEPAPEVVGDWKADLVAAIGKLVASEDPADHDMAKKIMTMLKPGGAATTTEADEKPGGKKEEEKEEEEKMESLQRELDRLKNKDAVRELCEAEQFTPSKPQFKALLNLCEADRKELVKELREISKPKLGVRSVGAHQLSESRKEENNDVPKDADGLLAAITR